MKRVFAVIEFADRSDFDPSSDIDMDHLAEDLLVVASKVRAPATYSSLDEMVQELWEAHRC